MTLSSIVDDLWPNVGFAPLTPLNPGARDIVNWFLDYC